MTLEKDTTNLASDSLERRMQLIKKHNLENKKPAVSKEVVRDESEEEDDDAKKNARDEGPCKICGISFSKFPQHMATNHPMSDAFFALAAQQGLTPDSLFAHVLLRRKTPLRLAMHRILQNADDDGRDVPGMVAGTAHGELLAAGLSELKRTAATLKAQGKFGVSGRGKGVQEKDSPSPKKAGRKPRDPESASGRAGKRKRADSDAEASPAAAVEEAGLPNDPPHLGKQEQHLKASAKVVKPRAKRPKKDTGPKVTDEVATAPMEIIGEQECYSDPELLYGEPKVARKQARVPKQKVARVDSHNGAYAKSAHHAAFELAPGSSKVSGSGGEDGFLAKGPLALHVPGLNVSLQPGEETLGSYNAKLIRERLMQIACDMDKCPKAGIPLRHHETVLSSVGDLIEAAEVFGSHVHFRVTSTGVTFKWEKELFPTLSQ